MDWKVQEFTKNDINLEIELKEPEEYKVIFLNDDYTTMDFVVAMLVSVFHKSEVEAVEIMEKVHKTGSSVVGIYSYDIALTRAIAESVKIPVIASGGAGCAEDFVKLFKTLPKVDAGLAASIFHFGQVQIPELKKLLRENDILVRL